MAGAPIHTWKDLLLPNEQDTRVILSRVTEEQTVTPMTSSLSLPAWDPERLPPSAHLFEDLPSRMQEHLRVIVDQHFSDQAAGTSFTNHGGYINTPDHVVQLLQDQSRISTLSYEAVPLAITTFRSYGVKVIYEVLTGKWLDVQPQRRTSNSSVITDHIFRFDDGSKSQCSTPK